MTVDSGPYSFRIIWSAEDEAYVATCPEFDGVSGAGKSAEAALKEARVALRLALATCEAEGWTAPAARMLAEHSGQFRLRIPRSLHARLVQRAEDEGVSLNALALALLAQGMGAPHSRAGSRRALRLTP